MRYFLFTDTLSVNIFFLMTLGHYRATLCVLWSWVVCIIGFCCMDMNNDKISLQNKIGTLAKTNGGGLDQITKSFKSMIGRP